MRVYPEHLRLDGGTQPRAALQQDVIQEYREMMVAGVKFPPLTVFHDGEAYWLADGYHRLGALLRINPSEPIDCDVRQGTCADAQWYSYSANQTHGLRRSNDDKRRAVQAALAHPSAATLSDSQIAQHCGVCRDTVLRCRQVDLRQSRKSSRQAAQNSEGCNESSSKDWKSAEPTEQLAENYRPSFRKGRDGRTINTARIGQKAAKKRRTPSGTSPRAHRQIRGYDSIHQAKTALELPHDAEMGARTLISVFDSDYLRKLVEVLTQHLSQQGASV
jgi:hypothetical protein